MRDEETLTSKEVLFMLDTDMEQDMKSYGQEVTELAIKYINSTPELYNRMKKANSMSSEAVVWAEEHNDEFGALFITELEMVDWDRVRKMV